MGRGPWIRSARQRRAATIALIVSLGAAVTACSSTGYDLAASSSAPPAAAPLPSATTLPAAPPPPLRTTPPVTPAAATSAPPPTAAAPVPLPPSTAATGVDGNTLATALLTVPDLPANFQGVGEPQTTQGNGPAPGTGTSATNGSGALESTKQSTECRLLQVLLASGNIQSGPPVTAYAFTSFLSPTPGGRDPNGFVNEVLTASPTSTADLAQVRSQLATLTTALGQCSPYTLGTGGPRAAVTILSAPTVGDLSTAFTETVTVAGATRTVGLEIVQVGTVTITLTAYDGPGTDPAQLLEGLAKTAAAKVQRLPGIAASIAGPIA